MSLINSLRISIALVVILCNLITIIAIFIFTFDKILGISALFWGVIIQLFTINLMAKQIKSGFERALQLVSGPSNEH